MTAGSVRNVGWFDRLVRVALGIGLLGLYGALEAPWRYFTLLGLVLIATSLRAVCPIYRLLGWSTVGGGSGAAAATGPAQRDTAHGPEPPSAHREARKAEAEDRTWPPKKPPPWRPGNNA